MAFQITLLFLGHRTLDSTPPEALPQPGQRHFAPVLSGATLTAGSVAEVYASATSDSQPDYISVIKIVRQSSNDGMEVEYATYTRTCAIAHTK